MKEITLSNSEFKALVDDEAAKAYDNAAFKYFKEFAVLNFPQPLLTINT